MTYCSLLILGHVRFYFSWIWILFIHFYVCILYMIYLFHFTGFAFDTLDRDILSHHLEKFVWHGPGLILLFFVTEVFLCPYGKAYLISSLSQRWCVPRISSWPLTISSVLYELPLGQIIHQHNIHFHHYIHDTQLNVSLAGSDASFHISWPAFLTSSSVHPKTSSSFNDSSLRFSPNPARCLKNSIGNSFGRWNSLLCNYEILHCAREPANLFYHLYICWLHVVCR